MKLTCEAVARSALGIPVGSRGAELLFRCPRHDDLHPSLQINPKKNVWLCGPCGVGGNEWELAAFLVGCDPSDRPVVRTWLAQHGLLKRQTLSKKFVENAKKEVAAYSYTDVDGGLLYQKVRYEPKDFAIRRPDGNGGWLWGMGGVTPLLYNLPEVVKSHEVLYVEGEKDVETARSLGFVATTSGSVSSWRKEFAEVLKGRAVPIVADSDEAGRKHAQQVAGDWVEVAEQVRVLELAGAKDLTEWVEKGGTAEQLRALIAAAPLIDPKQYETGKAGPPVSVRDSGTQADKLIAAAAQPGVELFHSPDGEPYAVVPVRDHLETWPVKSSQFRDWLVLQYYRQARRAPGPQPLQLAIYTLAAQACYDGEERPVFIRTAEREGSIYVDLTDESWRCVEITPSGWRVIDNPNVRFVRKHGMRPLPVPVRGGNLAGLRKFVNVGNNADWILLASWLIAALRPSGPYPSLALHGAQGSAKSTTARLLRELVDPNKAPIRSEPRDPRDLMIAARNGWVIALDNLSYVPSWLSDALCRLATGGAFGTRELYSDYEEVLFEATRPVILTGIEELATRGDLLDRSIVLYLPPIPEEKRRAERDFWQEFQGERPALLGALFDSMSTALCNLPTTSVEKLPRMADFAQWAIAAEETFAYKGAFCATYQGNQDDANQIALEGSLVAQVVEQMVLSQGDFQGTCSRLLEELNRIVGEEKRKDRNWPKSPQALSNKLRRLLPNLQRAGIDVRFAREASPGRRRTVSIQNRRETASTSSTSSNSLSFQQEPWTMVDDQTAPLEETSSIANLNNPQEMDDVDDDGRSFPPTFTESPETESWEL